MNIKKILSLNTNILDSIGEKRIIIPAISFFLLIVVLWNAFLNIGYEGGWNLYAKSLNSGANIHIDLHYLLPSFFPDFFRSILNNYGDLATKFIFTFIFALIPLLSFFILKKETKNFSDRQVIYISLLIPFICLMFKPLRIEDYHIISVTSFLITAYLLSHKKISVNALSFPFIAIAFLNRIHDGIFLAIGSAILIFLRHGGIKFLVWLILISIFLIQSLHYFDPDYLELSVLSTSATTKGVSFFSIFAIPRNVIVNFIGYITSPYSLLFISLIAGLAYLLINNNNKSKFFNYLFWALTGSICILLTKFPSHLTTIIFLMSLFLIWKSKFFQRKDTSSYLIVFTMYFLSSNISSGGAFLELFPQAALLLIAIIIFVDSKKIYSNIVKKFFYSIYFTVFIALITNIIYKPFAWHNYSSPPLFTNFEFQNGHLLKRDIAVISEKFCPIIKDKTVFSTPLSFYTHHCNASPWSNAISTFYDTSDSQWIDSLANELDSNPPSYIVYTRQIGLMWLHSRIFNKNRKIENFKIDHTIMSFLYSGRWKVLYVFSMDGTELYDSKTPDSPHILQDVLNLSNNKNVIFLIDTTN